VSVLTDSLSSEAKANVKNRVQLEVTWMLSEEEISEIRASAADGKNRKLVSCLGSTEVFSSPILLTGS
jgi:hypothetical protein